MTRARLFILLLLIAAFAGAAFFARSYCPGDPCLWRWYSTTCAFLCPYDVDVGPLGPDVGIPAKGTAE